jgi:hypothetical protein
MRRVATKFLPPLLTDAQKENHVTVSQELFDRSNAVLLSRFGPCGLFLVPKVEILTKKSPILDGRGDRRTFDTVPSRHPQNTFQDTFQNRKKRWEQCINSEGEYFEGDKFD